MKLKQCIIRNKYSIFTFIFLCLVWILFRGYDLTDILYSDYVYMTMYFIDLSVGFCSRTLIGEIAKLLSNNNVTVFTIKAMIQSNIFIFILLVSVVVGKILRKCGSSRELCGFTVFGIFAACSITYCIFGAWHTPVFDLYWMTCTVLCLLIFRIKYLRWFVPLLCFIAMWINYGFVVTCFPIVALPLIYETYRTKKGRKATLSLTVTTFCMTGVSAVYFMFIANKHLKMTMEQMHSYVIAKMPEGIIQGFEGLDAYLYGNSYGKTGFDPRVLFTSPRTLIENLASIGIDFSFPAYVFWGLVVILLLFAALWLYLFIRNRDKGLRFVLLCNLVVMPIGYLSTVTSTDDYRVFIFAVIAQIVIIIYMLYNHDNEVANALNVIIAILKRKRIPAWSLPMLALLYAYAAKNAAGIQTICLFLVYFLLRNSKRWLAVAGIALAILIEPVFSVGFGQVVLLLVLYDAATVQITDSPGKSKPKRRKTEYSNVKSDALLSATASFLLVVGTAVYCYASNMTYIGIIGRKKRDIVVAIFAGAVFAAVVGSVIARRYRITADKLSASVGSVGLIIGIANMFFYPLAYTHDVPNSAVICTATSFLPLIYCFSMPYKSYSKINERFEKLADREPFLFSAVPALAMFITTAM